MNLGRVRTTVLSFLHPRVRAELPRFMMFGVIGLSSLGLTIGVYAFLTRIAWPHGPRTVEYAFTTIVVTWLNYEANSRFTFGAKQRNAAALGRFAGVAIVALGLNTVLFWFGHEVMRLADLWVIVANAFIVAIFTFTSHRLFTFHERPWRWLR